MKKYVLRPQEGGTSRIEYDKHLNPQQLEVVNAGEGPLLVIAGAGSGKTRTLTYRVSRLVESGVPPTSILLVTFTNKAAREMLRRVEHLLETDIRSLVGGTFHHVGNMFLRKHAELVGYRSGFTILDREDSRDLMGDLVSQSRTLAGYKKKPKGDVIVDMHSFAVNTGTEVSRVIADRYPVFLEIKEELMRLGRQYKEKKRELNVMDFDDLLVHWRSVLRENPEVLEATRRRFRYLLVDEYQDTNKLQAEVVESIAGENGNIMVVGDDAQSIYSFRGADFGNIIDFPKRFPNCRMYKLETNYRSTPQVLDLANSSIRNNERQFEKTLRPSREGGPVPEVVVCGTPEEQSSFIAQRMMELRDEGMDLQDIAVLYRAHWHSMELQMELTRRGIPYQVRSGLRFFEQAHVKDVVSYLKVIANPLDELAWKRILKLVPKIGKKTAEKIFVELVKSGNPLMMEADHAIPRGAKEAWNELKQLIGILREPAMETSPSEMIRQVLEDGYETHLAANYANASARVEDIRRFADFALRFKEVHQLLSELMLTAGVVADDSTDTDEETDWTILTTVHQAKGLEWKVVFLVWCVEGKIPDQRSVKEIGGEEEERRLFYVAATRAKDQLFFVYPTMADERGLMGVIQRPSRFISELDQGTYEESVVGYGNDFDY